MKTYKKVILIILAFILCYGGFMLVVYNKFYDYPKGYLDIIEREDNALSYAIIQKDDLEKNGKTILYISRSSAGGGSQAHFGIISSSLPPVFANFKAESQASVYFPMNAYGFTTTTNSKHPQYLFGTTTDMNTVMVRISFFVSDDDIRSVDIDVKGRCFYTETFDPSIVNYPSRIYGFNDEGGITFEYAGDALKDGGYIAKK